MPDDRLLTAKQEEAVRENLKNVVLFMASSGYLVSPRQDPQKEKLWTETWKRIDRFMPELKSDLGTEDEGEGEARKENETSQASEEITTAEAVQVQPQIERAEERRSEGSEGGDEQQSAEQKEKEDDDGVD